MTYGPRLTHRDTRKLSLLWTLMRLNGAGEFPTATALVKKNDGRETIPADTITSRRGIVRDLRNSGFIVASVAMTGPFDYLAITRQGIEALKEGGADES